MENEFNTSALTVRSDNLPDQADSLQSRLVVGNLRASDFQMLKRGQSAELVIKLATGNRDQRDNLIQLMLSLEFSETLSVAMIDMPPADISRVFINVGEHCQALTRKIFSDCQIVQIRSTLAAALDCMILTQLDDIFRQTILSGNTLAIREAVNYLDFHPDAALSFVKSVTSDILVEDVKMSQLLVTIGQTSLANVLQRIAAEPDDSMRELCKRIGDAVFDSQQDRLFTHFEQSLDTLADDLRNILLMKVISDLAGNHHTDKKANKGQRLIADYLDRKCVEVVRRFLLQIPESQRLECQKFMHQNLRSEETLRAINRSINRDDEANENSVDSPRAVFAKSESSVFVEIIKKPSEISALTNRTSDKSAGLNLDNTKHGIAVVNLLGSVASLVNIMQPTMENWRIEIIGEGLPPRKPISNVIAIKILANKIEGEERPWLDSAWLQLRDQIDQIDRILKSDVTGLLLELTPSDLKNIVKAYMRMPTHMGMLAEILDELTPQTSAKLFRAVNMAAAEVVAEIKAGSWLGDLFKGLTISGKIGRSSSVQVGDAKTTGAQASLGISAEIGFTWSSAALVDGGRNREGTQLTAKLNSFMMNWMVRLNRMTPNQKWLFLEEMKDIVTLKLSN